MAKNKPTKRTKKRDDAGDDRTKTRNAVLAEALDAISQARNVDYGEPQDDFACTSGLWESYIWRIIQTRGYPRIFPHDVSAFMILLKISRLAESPANMDHWVDIAGYAAIGAECAQNQDDSDCC